MLEVKLSGIETTKKDQLKFAAKEEMKTARNHQRLSNQARKARDWAIHCMLHRGEDRQATATHAAAWAKYHREQAVSHKTEAAVCLSIANTL